MKILIADKFQPIYLNELKEQGHEVTFNPELKAEDLPDQIGGYECLIVRSTKVTPQTIKTSDKLSLIIRAGAGTNTIATEEAAARGIFVCNCPGKNAIAVAEIAMGLLLSVDRNIPDNVLSIREKKWNKKKFSKTQGLYGRNVGVIGLGKIGLAFAERAHGFGMKVHVLGKKGPRDAYTESVLEKMKAVNCESMEELAKACYAISVHVPVKDNTKGMIGKSFLSHMQPNSILINTARGQIVDDDALIAAMDEKGIRAGLDVYNNEPTTGESDFETPLSTHPNVYGTHHIGASTEQSQNAIGAAAVEVITAFCNGQVMNCVNQQKESVATCTLTVRHFDKVGVLAEVLTTLKNEGVNVEEMENQIFQGATAACATIRTDQAVSDDLAGKIQALDNIIGVSVKN